MRRNFVCTIVAAAVCAVAPGLASGQSVEKQKVTIAVGGKAAFYYLPLAIAEQLGYFRDEGVNVEVIDFAGGSKALQAVVGGSADVVSGAYEHTINLQSRKQYFTAFVMQGRAPQIVLGVSTKSGIKSAADLKGKKIGVSAPGSSTNMVASYVLAKNGLKATDAAYVGVGTGSGAIAAMRSGQIDALSNVDPIMTMLERSGDIKVLTDTRTLKATNELFGGAMPAGCLYAPEDFIKKNPRTVQAMANAMVRAVKWLQTAGPSDIIKTVPEAYLLGDRALYLAAYLNGKEAISTDGLMPNGGPENTLKAVSSFNTKLDASQIDLARTFTNDFAKKAHAKYK